MAPIGSAVGFDVLAVAAQVGFHPLQLLMVLPELGLVGLNLGFAGVVCPVSGKLLFVLLDNLFLLLNFLLVLLNILFVFLDIVLQRPALAACAGGTGLGESR